MAVLGTLVTVGLLAASVVLWRRRARVPGARPPGRGLLALVAVCLLVTAAFFAVVTAGQHQHGPRSRPGPPRLLRGSRLGLMSGESLSPGVDRRTLRRGHPPRSGQ